MEVVVEIEAEADAYEDPKDAEPNQRSSPIFTCRPRSRCMNVQSFPFCQSVKHTAKGLNAMNYFWW